MLFIIPVKRMVLLYSSAISNMKGRFTFTTTGSLISVGGGPMATHISVNAAASVSFSSTLIFTCWEMLSIRTSLTSPGTISAVSLIVLIVYQIEHMKLQRLSKEKEW